LAKNGDFLESLISLLFIIFFIFGGFFKKKEKRPKTETKKTPYKPIFPPITAEDEHEEEPAIFYERKRLEPATLKGAFAEVLEHLGKGKELMEPAAGDDTFFETDLPKIWFEEEKPKKQKEAESRFHFPSYPERKIAVKEEEKAASKPKKRGKEKPSAEKKTSGMVLSPFLDRSGMQRAVIMSEILQKPLALRRRR
jgi:hypothetical protein